MKKTLLPPHLVIFLAVLSTLVSGGPPNIVFLLTDDQDVTANSLDYMPRLNKLLREEGMEFVNCFVPTALCCPSRTTILRGQYCHNHGIWDIGDLNNDTFLSGGIEKVIATKLEEDTIATLMKKAGYKTYLIGKYLNGYTDKYADHVPPGWDYWYGMTDNAYFGPHFSINGEIFRTDNDTYQTDFISSTVIDMIIHRDKSKPFFLYISPYAPHAPSLPAPRHAHLFNSVSAPRYDSFNPDDDIQQQKPSWLKHLPKLTSDQISNIDEFHRNRLRALQAVDEMLENITLILNEEGIADNTYLFYMGDNGEHLGDYRLPAGKRQAYDTDIRVPFFVRGPGIAGGTKVTEVVLNTDLLSTWLDLAGGELPKSYEPDGKSIVPLLTGQMSAQPEVNTFRAAALAEMYGGSSNMGSEYNGMAGFELNEFWNNTYQAVRVINGSDWAAEANWLYAQWCTGEIEFYNVTNDTRQIYNMADYADRDLLQKLSKLTETLGQCSGKACIEIDFAVIGDHYRHQELSDTTLKCHNPPDMLSNEQTRGETSLSDTSWDTLEHSEYVRKCKALLSVGFPYSDDKQVPQREMNIWQSCIDKTL